MWKVSEAPQPIRNYWHNTNRPYSPLNLQSKEVSSFPSLLNWHCGLPMIKVILFEKKVDGTISRCNYDAWVCQVCEARKAFDYSDF